MNPDIVTRLISIARHSNFDISSDAFSSLHDLLLTHKIVSSVFLEKNFPEFFPLYNDFLVSSDYVAQRQALKLLSETLLDRIFQRIMLKYIGDEQNLKIHMNFLLVDSKAIQLEAFQVLKIFVANPSKPPRVQHILHKNKEKLVKLLSSLHADRLDDKQFSKDMKTVIGTLHMMEPPPKFIAKRGGSCRDPSHCDYQTDAASTSRKLVPEPILAI